MKNIAQKLKLTAVNLLIAAALVVAIAAGVLHWLDKYTAHGTFIAVPDFTSCTPEEAATLAAAEGLRVQVIDSIHDREAPRGAVVKQNPAIGEHVKAGRLIHLIINARTSEKAVFPSLKNTAYRQTLQTLEARGFRIGRIGYMPSEFRNLVLQLKTGGEEIPAGTLLPKGTVVDIVLGSGNGSTLAPIPSVKGKTLEEAVAQLRNAYFNIGTVTPDTLVEPGIALNKALVYLQQPSVDTPIERGSDVRLYVTFDPRKAAMPDSLLITDTLTLIP